MITFRGIGLLSQFHFLLVTWYIHISFTMYLSVVHPIEFVLSLVKIPIVVIDINIALYLIGQLELGQV